MARVLIAISLLLGLVAAPPVLADGKVLHAFLDNVHSMQAHFEQTLYDENNKRIEDSSGTFYLERPGKFRWSYDKPYPQEIVGDGSRVWIYDSELSQVTVKSFDAALGNTPALLLSTDQPLEKSFVLRELPPQGGLTWTEVRPRDPQSSFTVVRLGFRDGDLAMMDLVDNFGQSTQLKFTNVRRNPTIDPKVFQFTPPPGVDVIRDLGPEQTSR